MNGNGQKKGQTRKEEEGDGQLLEKGFHAAVSLQLCGASQKQRKMNVDVTITVQWKQGHFPHISGEIGILFVYNICDERKETLVGSPQSLSLELGIEGRASDIDVDSRSSSIPSHVSPSIHGQSWGEDDKDGRQATLRN